MALDVPHSEGIILWLWFIAIFPFKRQWFGALLTLITGKTPEEVVPVHESSGSWGSAESLGYIGMWDE
tara:strand:+ start:1313 stop:1516 length:204 start_codon:yes stop_codon:yes gene_type:complete